MPKIGIVMDPPARIQPEKDTTIALLIEAQRRGWQASVILPDAFFWHKHRVQAHTHTLCLHDKTTPWYSLEAPCTQDLHTFDIILMRKDPPVDRQYIYITHLLDHVERTGVLVCNKPASLRDVNEKLYTTHFPQCCPATLISQQIKQLKHFVQEHGTVILKPLYGMGGAGIFKLSAHDANLNPVLEVMTQQGEQAIMAQSFIADSVHGDKRIIMINGQALPYALNRVPQGDEFRGNLARGAKAVGTILTQRDQWLCAQIGTALQEKGLYFVGLDVIGDYLTEINVTSPTCIREIDQHFNVNVSSMFYDFLVSIQPSRS